jgi:glutaredoxin
VDRSPDSSQAKSKSKWWFGKRKVNTNDVDKEQQSSRRREKEKAGKPPQKKIPVLFFDEAHKLSVLLFLRHADL